MHRKAMKTWYVYAHYNLNTNELFCIGVGTGKRAYNKNRNQLWKNIVVKHGYRVEMLRTGFTNRDEAVKVEIRLQQLNKPRACFQYGDRLNSIQSQETKDKRAKALTGKKRSKETKQLLSRALKTGRTAGKYEDGTKVRWSYHVNS